MIILGIRLSVCLSSSGENIIVMARTKKRTKILVDITYVDGEIMAAMPWMPNPQPIPITFREKVAFLEATDAVRMNRRRGTLRGKGLRDAKKIVIEHQHEVHNIDSPLANEYGSIMVDSDDFIFQ
jgi:hypothetical protein